MQLPVRSLVARLILVTGALVTAGAVALLVEQTRRSRRDVEAAELARIGAVARTLAPRIDGDVHRALLRAFGHKDAVTGWSTAPAEVRRLHDLLREAVRANGLTTPIYTLVLRDDARDAVAARPDVPRPLSTEFGITSSDAPYWRHPYQYKPEMAAPLLRGEPSAVGMYHDEHGTWISAYAPIKARDGQVVALLEVDASMDLLMARIDAEVREKALWLASLTAVLLVVLTLVARGVAAPLQRLAEAADRFGRGEHASPITVGGPSEVQRLSRALEEARRRIAAHDAEQRANRDELARALAASEATAWLRASQAELAAHVRGELPADEIARRALDDLVRRLGAQLGVVYVCEPGGEARLTATHGYGPKLAAALPTTFAPGEGLVGEALRLRRVRVDELPPGSLQIAVGIGELELRSMTVAPLAAGSAPTGVIVLAGVRPPTPSQLELVELAAEDLAIRLQSALSRASLERLLEQQRAQARELRLQNDEIIRQQQALDEKNRQLVEASQHKSQFLASMSHELRTPLNAMIGYTSLAASALAGSIPEKQLQNLRNAEQAARTLLDLVNQVLDFSKIEAGQLDVDVEELSLVEVAEEVMATARGLPGAAALGLELDVADDLPRVRSDFVKLKQILTNLVSNAVKATSAGRVVLRLRPERERPRVRIEVEDTGCGIPEDKLDTIFEAFKQLDGSIRKRYGGTGLGLAITRRLCDALGIRLSVRSEVGTGTTFELDVPSDGVRPDRAPTPARLPLPARSSPAGDRRVPLPVDEDRAAGKARAAVMVSATARTVEAVIACASSAETAGWLQDQLSDLPLRVVRVEGPDEVVALAQRGPVWAVLVSPEQQGWEHLTRLKTSAETSALPVIVCGDAPGGFELGPVECLAKPLDGSQLVEALLRASRARTGAVLVVEDDPACAELHGQLLANAGFSPLFARTGHDAIEWLRRAPVEAVVLDLLMPEMDGFQVLEAMQARPEWRRLPVVVVSGKDLTAAERQVLERGNRLLLSKGATAPDALADHVQRLVRSIEFARGSRLLVVDDNPMNRDLMAEIFRQSEYSVVTADGGAGALEVARRERPDAVLMDLAMPGMDGFETTVRLRADLGFDGPVIACSAFSLADFHERAVAAGCDGYIAKPIEPTRLVAQVKRIVLAVRVRACARADATPTELAPLVGAGAP